MVSCRCSLIFPWVSYRRSKPIHRNQTWLVVEPPLWKIWVRQLGWWHSQLLGKIKAMFQTTNQKPCGDLNKASCEREGRDHPCCGPRRSTLNPVLTFAVHGRKKKRNKWWNIRYKWWIYDDLCGLSAINWGFMMMYYRFSMILWMVETI